mgnify:FL=1
MQTAIYRRLGLGFIFILSLFLVSISGRNDPAAAQADTSAGIRKEIESGLNAPALPS